MEILIKQINCDEVWPLRHRVMYPTLSPDAVKLEADPEGTHFGLFVNGKLTSVVSLFKHGSIYQFRKFATELDAQGKGYGSALLTYLIKFVTESEGGKLWCNARVSATRFYSKFGFKETGQFSVSNNIDFVIMELKLNPSVGT